MKVVEQTPVKVVLKERPAVSHQSGLSSGALLQCVAVPAICRRRDRISLTRLINSMSLEPRSLSMASFTVKDTPSGPGVNSFLSEAYQKQEEKKWRKKGIKMKKKGQSSTLNPVTVIVSGPCPQKGLHRVKKK